MTERIQKILSSRGVASRRQAEAMILAGRVRCNGAVCALGDKADPEKDEILLDGKPLPTGSEHIYIMLHKPKGYVTTLSDEKGRRDVSQLVSDCGCRVYPVGRLDMDSEGLLILTNDGEFANRLMHPSQEVDKVYEATVKCFSQKGLALLARPIVLDGYRIRKPEIRLLSGEEKGEALIRVVIHEGRNRQVRRMCACAGMPVKRLVRVAEGGVCLGALPAGKWRHLTQEEIRLLKG